MSGYIDSSCEIRMAKMEIIGFIMLFAFMVIIILVTVWGFWEFAKDYLIKNCILVNSNGDYLIDYRPGRIKMISDKSSIHLDGELLKMTFWQAMKMMDFVETEGFEIYIQRI